MLHDLERHASTVLVVDDEQLIRWSLRKHLERAGYRVADAECGGQALERLDEDTDLVLLDLRLPDSDDLSLLQEIKHRCPRCQVILMTAYGSPELAREALDHGACRVVDKPFDLDEMSRAVGEALRTRR
jgi:DNA-binding NtrC family response regulator